MSWGYYKSETVAEKKAKAQKKINALRKKGQSIAPVQIEGRTIAKSWWGKAWNKNLESYSDYGNRLPRGKSYLTSGCVIDLQISCELIQSQVIGSGRSVYDCEISIDPLDKNKWQKLKKLVGNKISSITDLLAGTFPKELEPVFSAKNEGLFPSPKEINLFCSCPDSARLCKHLAATIYGVGNRLDQNPNLLFTLRGINSEELVTIAISAHKDDLISKASKVKSKRIMKMNDRKLATVFDIDFSMPEKKSKKK